MYRRLADALLVGICVTQDGKICYANQGFAHLLGYDVETLNGYAVKDLFAAPSESRPPFSQVDENTEGPQSFAYQTSLRTRHGDVLDVEVSGTQACIKGKCLRFIVVQRAGVCGQQDSSVQLARLVYEHSAQAIVVTDKQGIVVDANPAFSDITGYSLEEMKGRNMSALSSSRQSPDFYKQMWQTLSQTGQWEGDIWNRRKNGEEYAERLHISTIWNADGTVYRRIGLFSDITQHKKREALILRQANHDFLTGLPNRQYFQERLQMAMDEADQSGGSFALIFLDLDLFKEVNDTYGHSVGDQLLKEVGQRLLSCVRTTDTVARVGGDEFTIILPQVPDTAVLDRICTQILSAVAKPYLLEGESLTVSASLGITFYPQDGSSAEDLLKHADMAMYAAKDSGRNQYCFFLPAMGQAVHARAQFLREMKTAIQQQQFCLHYQPILNLATGKVTGVEALLRWNHPALGLTPPSEFLAFAEETGLIVDIGNWVFETVVQQAAEWKREGRNYSISLNLSPVQFAAHNLNVNDWVEYLRQHKVSASSIILEINEQLLVGIDPRSSQTLMALREAGFHIALDGFGVGMSSLTHLQRHPIDYVKIDQQFMTKLMHEPSCVVLCEAMIIMAHKLGLRVVAEGVSNFEQLGLLQTMRCDWIQGYVVSPPLPVEEFMTWMQETKQGSLTVKRPVSS